MKSAITKLEEIPISVGGGAVYPYSEGLLNSGTRTTKYDESYNLYRVIGSGEHKRILVPRNIAPKGGIDNTVVGMPVKFNSTFVPWDDEQARVVQESSLLLLAGVSHLTQAPPGFGKTVVGCQVIANVGRKTIVVVTKEDVVDQWNVAFRDFLGLSREAGTVGLIQGDICDTVGKDIVIAMVHSLAKEDRYPESHFRGFGLMIVDELHRLGSDFFSQACYRVPAKLRWGLSATPLRKDGRNDVIEAHLGVVKVKTDAQPMGFKVIKVRSPWECPMRRKVQKDKTIKMVQMPHAAGRCGHIIKLIAGNYKRNKVIADFVSQAYQAGRKILVQSDLLEHLEVLRSMIGSMGVPSGDMGHYASGLTKEAREVIKGKRVVFATFMMTAEATNIPTLDTLVLGTPKADVIQIVGRIRRFVKDKKEPLVFDVVDDTSSVFQGYANARFKWYHASNAPINIVQN